MSFEPCVIVLEFTRAVDAGDPNAVRYGPQDYLLRSSGGGFKQGRLDWDNALLAELTELRSPTCDAALRARCGERLRQFVESLGWSDREHQMVEALTDHRPIFVTVRSAAAELYALPWELLPIQKTGQYIGELPNVLLRYEWPQTQGQPETPMPRTGSGRILFAWSSAGGAVPAAEQLQTIGQACEESGVPFDPGRDVLSRTSLRSLASALATARREESPVSVLHLLCHGVQMESTFGVLLNRDDDSAQDYVAVPADRLREVLNPYTDMIRLVVLSACDSGNTGQIGNALGSVALALHRIGIPSVIASRYPLSVGGSVRLTGTLYRSLLVDLQPLEQALLRARRDLMEDAGTTDWASLQLYAAAIDGYDTRPIVFRPYPGLSAFSNTFSRFFFGREAATEALWQRCQRLVEAPDATRIAVVMAPSGVGKSSLVLAGLLPLLRRRPLTFFDTRFQAAPLLFAVLRPGAHPLQALAAAVPSQSTTAPRVVVIDQFEEVYTLCDDAAERDRFVDRLLKLASGRGAEGGTLVVLTLRTDFMAETVRHHPRLSQLLADQAQLVVAMSPEELRSAITRPADKLGRPIDDATIRLLLEQAQGRDGSLPLLGFALSQIWEGMLAGHAPGRTLEKIGGVGGALAGQADSIYQSLEPRPGAQETARRALTRLIQMSDGTRYTRRRMALADLCGRYEAPDHVMAILRRFADERARLVTLGEEHGQPTAELTHEALLDSWKSLRGWVAENRTDRALYDRAAQSAKLWEEAQRPAGRLWRPPDLDQLNDYQRRNPAEIAPRIADFLQASNDRFRRERLQVFALVLTVVVALSIAAGVAVTATRRAAQREKTEQIRSFVERGRQALLHDDSPDKALMWLHRARAEGSDDPALPLLLKGALQQAGQTWTIELPDTSDWAEALFSPDSHHLAVSTENRVQLWNTDTASHVWTQPDDRYRPSLRFSSDGRLLLLTSNASVPRVWHTATGKTACPFPTDTAGEEKTYSPDGRWLVTFDAKSRSARLWSIEACKPIRALPDVVESDETALRQAVSPDGHYRVVGMRTLSPKPSSQLAPPSPPQSPTQLRVREIDTGRILIDWFGVSGGNIDLFLRSDGGHLLVRQHEHIESWDLSSAAEPHGQAKRLGDLQTNYLGRVTFSPDGRRVVTTGGTTAQIWDVISGRALQTLRCFDGGGGGLSWSPDGERLVTTSQRATVQIWNANSGQLVSQLAADAHRAGNPQFDPTGNRVLAFTGQHRIRMWNLTSVWQTRVLASSAGIHHAVWNQDGKRLIALSGNSLHAWDPPAFREIDVLPTPTRVWSFVWREPVHRLLISHPDTGVQVWDTEHMQPLSSLLLQPWKSRPPAAGKQQAPDLVYDGDWLSPAGDAAFVVQSRVSQPDEHGFYMNSHPPATTAVLWRIGMNSVHRLRTVETSETVRAASFSPNRQNLLIVWRRDGVDPGKMLHAELWDFTDANKAPLQLTADIMGDCASYSPDGRYIFTCGSPALLWNADSPLHPIAALPHEAGAVASVSFSPQGDALVTTAGGDTTARLWRIARGQPPTTDTLRRTYTVLSDHPAPVDGSTFSPDGKYILTWSDRIAYLWEAASGQRIAQLTGHRLGISDASFSPDGHHVLTQERSYLKQKIPSEVRIWDLSAALPSQEQTELLIKCHVPLTFPPSGSPLYRGLYLEYKLPSPAVCSLPH